MALSKPVEGKIDNSKFNCPICSETFKSPKILPCFHTFCEQCIHEFILSMGRKTELKISEFNCPVCRTVVKPLNGHEEIAKWSAKLNNNVLIATIIEIWKGDSQQECHACKRHEQKNEAKFWCKECDEAFCEKCNSMHNWMKLLCTHDVVPIIDIGSETGGFDLKAIVENCTKHPSKMIEAFCFEHNELCCLVCLTSDHRGCENVKAIEQILDYATFDEKYQQSLVEMKAAANTFLNSKEKQAEATRFAVENLEEEAAKFLEQLKCKLDSLFESFSKQIHIFRDEQRTKMNVRIRL